MEKTGSKLTDMSDTDLVRLALEQNQAAYIVLYTRYNIGVRNHISRYVSQNEDIEDIMLESFQKANPEEDIIKQQEYDKWLANIDKLKDDYRTVAKMNLLENFGYKEIAETLDLPINTVKTRIRRAKEQLMKMMNVSDELQ